MLLRITLYTLVVGLVYGAVQQVLRQEANDPQIQIAEDVARALGRGMPLANIGLPQKIDIGESLALFMMIFDEMGKPIASTAELRGATPSILPGVFASAARKGEDRITWQPEQGVRSAIVVRSFDGAARGFVLAGRSLRETERREKQLFLEAGFVWLWGMIAIFGAEFMLKKKHDAQQ